MDIQIWDMIAKTERELVERRLEHKARQGRPSTTSRVKNTLHVARGWRINPFSSSYVRAREAS